MSLRRPFANALFAVGLLATGFLVAGAGYGHAQQSGGNDAPVLVAGTVDCNSAIRPYETMICSVPILAAMDLQLETLYNVVRQLVQPDVAERMSEEHRAFMRGREACAEDGNCIGQAYVQRIQEVDKVLQDLVAGGPY